MTPPPSRIDRSALSDEQIAAMSPEQFYAASLGLLVLWRKGLLDAPILSDHQIGTMPREMLEAFLCAAHDELQLSKVQP